MMLLQDNRAKLNAGQFIAENCVKTQIVLHHTGGSGNPFNTVHGWNTDKQGRVGTAIAIAGREDRTFAYKDGQAFEVFPIRQWAWATNARSETINHRIAMEKRTIGIELCNYGQLVQRNGKFFAVDSLVEIPSSQVVDLGWLWRGSRFYHAYTPAQLRTLQEVLRFLGRQFNINLKYNNLFQLDSRALKGENGVWGHCNFRLDKSDVSPQPQLIQALQTL